MTDNEIIKAAENCVKYGDCEHCPYDDERGCRGLYADMLDLINCQRAEIERLQDRLATECQHSIEFRNNTLREFAERLKVELKKECSPMPYMYLAKLVDATVKEMSNTLTKLEHNSLCETESCEG